MAKRICISFTFLSIFLLFIDNTIDAAGGGWISNVGVTPRRITRVCRDGAELVAYIDPINKNHGPVYMQPAKLFNNSPVDEAWFGSGNTILPEGLWEQTYPIELKSEYLPIISNSLSFDVPEVAQPEPINVNGTDYYMHAEQTIPFILDLEIGDQVGFGRDGINDIQPVEDCWLFDYPVGQNINIPEAIFAPTIPWLSGDNTLFTILSLPNSGSVELNGADQLTVGDQFSLAEIQPVGGYLAYTAENKTDEDQILTFKVSGTSRISLKNDGSQISGGGSFEPSISANGGRVAFTSNAGSLGTGVIDTGLDRDIFLRTSNTDTALISRNQSGNAPGSGESFSPDISPDGTEIAFVSEAQDLVGSGDGCYQTIDTNRKEDIFIWDKDNVQPNDIDRISMFNFNNDDISCSQLNEHSSAPSISGSTFFTGTSIVFQTNEPLELPFFDDKNDGSDLLLNRDFSGISNEPVYGINNLDIAPGPGVTPTLDMPNDRSYAPQISADGNTIAFQSDATDLIRTFSGNPADTNGVSDIYISEWDGTRWAASRVSVTSDGAQTTGGGSGTPSISQFGQHIAFMSFADNLDERFNNQLHIYVRDREAECTTLLSVNNSGMIGSSSSLDPSISANGQFVAFYSFASNLVKGDTNDTNDIFVVDRDADNDGEFYSDPENCVPGPSNIIRVSVASDGTQANGPSLDPDISANGAFVAFASDATNLVENDTNGSRDVFVHYLGFEGKIRFKASENTVVFLPLISQ